MKTARALIIAVLVLLGIQFEFGITLNLSTLPTLPPFLATWSNFVNAIKAAGVVAVIHAILGTTLIILALIVPIRSFNTRTKKFRAFSILSLSFIFMAEVNGVLFVLSGYQNDGVSHGMATFFILAFTFCFIELIILKA